MLTKTDSDSIRAFLRWYELYAREATERPKQIICDRVISTETAKPVRLKLCVNFKWLESVTNCGFISNVDSCNEIRKDERRSYVDVKAEASKDFFAVSTLDKLVKTDLRTDMIDTDALAMLSNLFVSYESLVCHHGLAWLITNNEKLAMYVPSFFGNSF